MNDLMMLAYYHGYGGGWSNWIAHVVLAASAVNTNELVPASWMTFLGCAVGNAADQLAEDGK